MHVCVAWALGEGWTEGGRGSLGRGSWGWQLGASCGRRTLDEMAAKHARRLALLEAAGGHEPSGTGTSCADCEAPRTILNTGVTWSDAAKTRLTFHYAGSAYVPSTVQPVLHRYNDAKYVWDDASARAWLAGLVGAHGVVTRRARWPRP